MDYREMSALGADPVRVRATASAILAIEGDQLDDKAHAFLSKLATYEGKEPLGTRRLEFLHALRERSTRKSKAGPYVAYVLARKAWERRLDLSDYEDEEWLGELVARGSSLLLSNAEWRRLIALCKRPEIDLISPDEWIDLK